MSEIIGKAYNPYGMPSGASGLASGFAMGRQIAKERGLASGVQDYVNAEASGDKAGMQKALGLMAGYAPAETMNWIQSQKNKEFNSTNERKNAEYLMGLGLPQEQAIKMAYKQNDSSNLSPMEKTLQQEQAKNLAEIQQKANALEANMPAFEEMAKKLNEVGKKSTYTWGGRKLDSLIRNLGLEPSEGAKARESYSQTVANELLPKLRETFGGQLSDAERESLLSTLGNVDLSPEEREQAVSAFIESKKRQLEGYKRQLGVKQDQNNVGKQTNQQPSQEDAIAELKRRGVI